MFNIELFKSKFHGRAKAIIDYATNNKGWMTFEELFNVGHRASTTQRKPADTRRSIKRFIIIGFLLADPKKGIKFNPDFIPLDQKPLLK